MNFLIFPQAILPLDSTNLTNSPKHSQSSSPRIVSPRIAEYRAGAIKSVDQKRKADLKAARTLRNGQLLQPVQVREDYLGVIDRWVGYAGDALKEANTTVGQSVVWAETAELILFNRYTKEFEENLEDDSDEEWYIGYDDDESILWEPHDYLSAYKRSTAYVALLHGLYETLEAMGHHRRMYKLQTILQAGQVTTEDRADFEILSAEKPLLRMPAYLTIQKRTLSYRCHSPCKLRKK